MRTTWLLHKSLKLHKLLSVFWFFLAFSACHFQPGFGQHHKSVQWTWQNPKFQFPKEQIQDGKAFYKLAVLPNSRLPIVCPNPSTYLNDMENPISNNQRYENVWYVDKESFQACKVGSPKENEINFVWLSCDNPSVLRFDVLVFQSFSAHSKLSFPPGTVHYFIATSNGSQSSLNSKSGGHCNDVVNGISMRMIIYVCYHDTDPACNMNLTDPPTTNNMTTRSTNQPGIATQASRISLSNNIWHLLTIIFGVGFACSLVIISICLFVVCRRHTAEKSVGEKDKLHAQTDETGLENVDAMTDSCRVEIMRPNQ